MGYGKYSTSQGPKSRFDGVSQLSCTYLEIKKIKLIFLPPCYLFPYIVAEKPLHLSEYLFNWRYRVAQKLWPKRSGLLLPYNLRNESHYSWNAFLSSAIRGFHQNDTKIFSFFVHFFHFSLFGEFWTIVTFISYHIMFGISYSIDPEKIERTIFSDDWDIKQKAYGHDVGLGDQTTTLSGERDHLTCI